MPQSLFHAVRFTWVALCVSVLIGTSATFAQNTVNERDDLATRQVIEDQLRAFSSGDHARAYSQASPNIQRLFPTVESFIGMVRGGYEAIYSSREHVFGRSADIDGQIHREVIVTDSSGKQWQAVYTLRRQEDGSWKISGVKMEPYKGVSA